MCIVQNNRKLLQFAYTQATCEGKQLKFPYQWQPWHHFARKSLGATCPNYLCASWVWAKIHVRSFLHCCNMVFPLMGRYSDSFMARRSQLSPKMKFPKSEDSEVKTWELKLFGHFSRGKKTQLISLNADRLWKQCWCLTMTCYAKTTRQFVAFFWDGTWYVYRFHRLRYWKPCHDDEGILNDPYMIQ